MMSNYPRKIADVVTINDGFFSHIPFNFPEDITKVSLDFQFYTRFSQKNTAPVIDLLLDDDVSRLTSAQLDLIGTAIWQTYNRKWLKQLAVYSIQYNPIYNYKDEYHETNEKTKSLDSSLTWSEDGSLTLEKSSTRTRTDTTDGTVTRTDDLSEQRSKGTSTTTTRTDNLTELETHNLTDLETRNTTETETRNLSESIDSSATNSVYGFNSSAAVGNTEDDSDSSKSNTGTLTTTNTGTVNNGKTGTLTTANTGTQQVVSGNSGSDTIANTGTQTTVTDSDTTSSDAIMSTDTTSSSKSGVKTNDDDVSEEGSRDYEHIGNIGNHTSQRLINEEIELWRWNFVEEILEDVKEFTTIPVYLY